MARAWRRPASAVCADGAAKPPPDEAALIPCAPSSAAACSIFSWQRSKKNLMRLLSTFLATLLASPVASAVIGIDLGSRFLKVRFRTAPHLLRVSAAHSIPSYFKLSRSRFACVSQLRRSVSSNPAQASSLCLTRPPNASRRPRLASTHRCEAFLLWNALSAPWRGSSMRQPLPILIAQCPNALDRLCGRTSVSTATRPKISWASFRRSSLFSQRSYWGHT